MATITRQAIEDALKKNRVWDLGNKVLYDLCSYHPGHKTHEEIIAKVWLIGRSYAAAIERRKNKTADSEGDSFYEEKVAPKIKNSDIDKWFEEIRTNPTPEVAVKIHRELTNLFFDISGLDKRSLASKYLHFHFEDLFFIYDGRALKAIANTTKRPQKILINITDNEADPAYKSFFQRCLWLQNDLKSLLGRKPSPREIDKIFLFVADTAKK
jgi:hypothetical protein